MIVALIFCGMQLCGYFTLVKLHGKIIPALIPGTEESVIPTGLEAGFLLRVGLEKKTKNICVISRREKTQILWRSMLF